MLVPLTKDKDSIAAAISSLKAGGATNINDGIFSPRNFLTTAPQGRRVIILISDDVGTDAGGEGTRDIITETIAADTSVYNLKIPGYNPPATRAYAASIPGLVNIRQSCRGLGRGNLRRARHGASDFGVQRAARAHQDALHARILHDGEVKSSGKPHKLDVRLAPSFGTKGRDYIILSKSSYYFVRNRGARGAKAERACARGVEVRQQLRHG
jgi:hypothetical protein